MICHHIPLERFGFTLRKVWLTSSILLPHSPLFTNDDSYKKNDSTHYHIYNFREYISASSSTYMSFWPQVLKFDYTLESAGKLKRTSKQTRNLGPILKDLDLMGMIQFDAVWTSRFWKLCSDFNMQQSLRTAIQNEDISTSSHVCPSQLATSLFLRHFLDR